MGHVGAFTLQKAAQTTAQGNSLTASPTELVALETDQHNAQALLCTQRAAQPAAQLCVANTGHPGLQRACACLSRHLPYETMGSVAPAFAPNAVTWAQGSAHGVSPWLYQSLTGSYKLPNTRLPLTLHAAVGP